MKIMRKCHGRPPTVKIHLHWRSQVTGHEELVEMLQYVDPFSVPSMHTSCAIQVYLVAPDGNRLYICYPRCRKADIEFRTIV